MSDEKLPLVNQQTDQLPHYDQVDKPPAAVTVAPTQQVVMVRTPEFHDRPVRVQCPNCNNDILTETSYRIGLLTWLFVAILVVVGFWFGCCLIPFCIKSMKDVDHTCPNCKYNVAKYERIG